MYFYTIFHNNHSTIFDQEKVLVIYKPICLKLITFFLIVNSVVLRVAIFYLCNLVFTCSECPLWRCFLSGKMLLEQMLLQNVSSQFDWNCFQDTQRTLAILKYYKINYLFTYGYLFKVLYVHMNDLKQL